MIEPDPEPLTVTPPPAVAAIEPLPTDNVTVMLPLAASTSAMERPLNGTDVSSFVVELAGSVLTGASFTAVTVPLTVAEAVPPAPSLIVYVYEAGPL